MLRNKTILPAVLGLAFVISPAALFAGPEIVYDSGNRRDPFVPLTEEDSVSVATSSSGIKLEGIIYDPGERSMAILNGKAYLTGEAVGNAKVVKILKDRVVISVDGEEKVLWIRVEEKT